ncbi:hypothetical protein [Arenimonas sp.]|uniref:hypothetical protein n=1 Tax=Arenimonas sp. TaxID=1872635 RepID=UPI0039E4A45E
MRRTLLALSLALATTCAFAHDGDHDVSRVNGRVHAEAGQAYGDLDTVNGGIEVDAGVQARDASTVNGGIDIGDRASLRSATTVNGGIQAGQNVRFSGEVETVNGGIKIGFHSQVERDVTTVNGSILIQQTKVDGQINTVNGDITVGADSVVQGGIKVEQPKGVNFGKPRVPRIVIGPRATVNGELRFEREVELFVHTSAKIGRVIGATAQPYTDTLPERK